jgi:hypothetical protein
MTGAQEAGPTIRTAAELGPLAVERAGFYWAGFYELVRQL